MKTTTKKHPHGFKTNEQRCCPTCLRPMRVVGDQWECEKHGKPAKP